MSKIIKILVNLGINAIVAGAFGLVCSFINLFWLQYIESKYDGVQSSDDYRAMFELGCACGFFGVGLIRMLQSRADSYLPRVADLILLVLVVIICMIAFTPVPGSHFLRYMIDSRSNQSVTPTNQVPGQENSSLKLP